MKILILLLLLLTSCTNLQEESNYVDLSNSKYSEFENVNIPHDFAYKSSVYGDYYTNFDDYILLGEIDTNIEEDIMQILSYYLPADFKPHYNLGLNYNSDEFTISSLNKFSDIKGKQINDKFIIIFSKLDLDSLYEKVFE